MILTCPECATRYFVAEDAVPPQGRTVRCASCSAEWRALPEVEPLTLAPEASPDPASPSRATPVSSVIRAKAKAKKETAQAAAVGMVWAGLGVGLAALIGVAVLFRVDVVRLWPRTAGAYAAVKLPVNPTGLVPENVVGAPGLQNGRSVLVVTGQVRNVTGSPRAPAALKVALFDKAGARLAQQEVSPPGGALKPGEARPFTATFADPPLNAAEFGVDFAFDAPSRRPVVHAPEHPVPHAAAPAPHPAELHATPAAPAASPPGAPSHAAAVAPVTGHVPEAQALPADNPLALHVTPPHG